MSVQKKLKSLSIHCQSYEDREFVLQFFQLEEMEGKRKFTYAYEKKPWFFKKSGDFDVHIEALRWDRESDLASGIAKMLAHPDSAVLNRVQFSRFTYAFFGEFLENYPTAKVDVQYEYHVTWQLSETEELESLFRLKQAKFWVAEFTLSKEIFSIHTLVNWETQMMETIAFQLKEVPLPVAFLGIEKTLQGYLIPKLRKLKQKEK